MTSQKSPFQCNIDSEVSTAVASLRSWRYYSRKGKQEREVSPLVSAHTLSSTRTIPSATHARQAMQLQGIWNSLTIRARSLATIPE